jgi:hypothetical protein
MRPERMQLTRMKPNLPGLLPISILMLAAILVAWLGIAGPIINDVKATGFISILEKWQTLIGVAGAFIVASIAIRPVWRQLQLQGAQAGLQLLPRLEKDMEDFDGDRRLFAALKLLNF